MGYTTSIVFILPLFLAVLLCAQPPTRARFFTSGFEYGRTLLREPCKKPSSEMVLYHTEGLEKWPLKNGKGFIQAGTAPETKPFSYLERKDNVLSGVSGVEADAPAFTQVFTAGLAEWIDVQKNAVETVSPGLHGAGAAKISFAEKPGSAYIRSAIKPSSSIYGRLYILFSDQSLSTITDTLPNWFLEAPSKKTGTFRVGVQKVRGSTVFCLRFHTDREKEGSFVKEDIYLYDTESVRPGTPYCVEFHYRGGEPENGGAGLWINGRLCGERFGFNTLRRGSPSEIALGAFSGYSLDSGHIIVDDIMLSDRRIGPIPEPTAQAAAQCRVQLEAVPAGGPFFLPSFVCEGMLNELRVPQTLPEELQTGKAEVRLRLQNSFGIWGPWGRLPGVEKLVKTDTFAASPVVTATMLDARGREVSRIAPDKWTRLKIQIRGKVMPNRLKVLLSAFSMPDSPDLERRDFFFAAYNYALIMDLKKKQLFIPKFEGREPYYEISGQTYKHVDGKSFRVDTAQGEVSVKFKLMPAAQTGPWRLEIKASYNNGNALPFVRPFTAGTDTETGTGAHPALLAVLLVIMISTAYLLSRKRRTAAPQAEGPAPLESFVDRGIRYIGEYFSDPELDMEKIARALNISKSSLSHQFKKQTGKSLPNYLNEIRLNRAKELLKTTDKRISEIAFEVGYNSIEHFNASFKKAEKVSPGQFREV